MELRNLCNVTNVIKKPDSVIKHPPKCLRKSTIVKSRSASSSGFVCQPVCFNKSVHKHISLSVVNKL